MMYERQSWRYHFICIKGKPLVMRYQHKTDGYPTPEFNYFYNLANKNCFLDGNKNGKAV